MKSCILFRWMFSIYLTTLVVLPVYGQGDEYTPPPRVTIKRTTALRNEARTTSARKESLTATDELRLVGRRPRNGFYRVINTRGQQGWVSARNIRIEKTAAAVVPFAAAAPCPTSLSACPPNGCGEAGKPQGIVNEAKQHIPPDGDALPLTFTDFRSLQDQANPLVNQKTPLTQAQRDLIKSLTVSHGSAGEGSLVSVTGFIAFKSKPHANSGESVNCRLSGQVNNDFHISVALRSTQTEKRSIVVEMIPQGRPTEWTITRLKKVQAEKRRVLIVGQLFYDNLHFVNPDGISTNDPKRFSLWEVHPITKFFVCVKPSNSCSPDNLSEWKTLETF